MVNPPLRESDRGEGSQQKTNASLAKVLETAQRWMPMDVEETQAKLATWAQDPEFRFDDVHNFITYPGWLHRAYDSVKSNSGSGTAGVDGQTVEDFGEDLDESLEDLSRALQAESYEPRPVRRVYIPKGDGEKRPLGIPTVRDRVVQEALRMVLEPIYETDFSQDSFGFRPGRSTHDAITLVYQHMAPALRGYMPWIIDADIAGFFDNVDHRVLEQILQKRIAQQKVRDLIWKFLKAGVMEGGEKQETLAGTPQGGIISPLLANIYLNELDQWAKGWTDLSNTEAERRRREGKGNWRYVRYADDFLMLTNGRRKRAEQMMDRVEHFVDGRLNLSLSEKKTDLAHAEGGIDFLGYHLEARPMRDGGGVNRTVPREAVRDVKANIRALTDGGTENSARLRVKRINAALRGWANYYKFATNAAKVFGDLEHFTWHRLTCWLAEKHSCTRRHLIANKLDGKSPIALHDVEMVDVRTMSENYSDSPRAEGHPYLEGDLERHSPPVLDLEPRQETRPGQHDQKWRAHQRDHWTCQDCGKDLTWKTAELHHLEYSGRLEDTESLCRECHGEKDPQRHIAQ